MHDPKSDTDQHPLAPDEGPNHAEHNDRTAVRVRGGVTTGAMRWVLGVGLLMAVAVLALVWGFTSSG